MAEQPGHDLSCGVDRRDENFETIPGEGLLDSGDRIALEIVTDVRPELERFQLRMVGPGLKPARKKALLLKLPDVCFRPLADVSLTVENIPV